VKVRKPAVAGSFYPKDPETLKSLVDKLLEKNTKEEPVGVISPHAGYVYSGKVAGKVLGLLDGKELKVLLVGPSHFVDFEGISFGDYQFFETPLGKVKVDRERIEEFLRLYQLPHALDNRPHMWEHSLEVQLPFLQRLSPNLTIVPIVYGRIDPETLAEFMEFFLEDDTHFVVSSDLSHYYPEETARWIDEHCHRGIVEGDRESLKTCEACGKVGILASLIIAQRRKLKPKLIAYDTSASAFGDKKAVVGYGGYAFFQ
jgi:AmmeMemoRadiSam system protein B